MTYHRITIDVETTGDADDAVHSLKDKDGKSILSFAASLGIVHLEEELENSGGKINVKGVGIHNHELGSQCGRCSHYVHHTPETLRRAGLDENYVPEQ